jgi:hypothetical protein
MNDFNKSDHQTTFNQVRGSVIELNDTGDFCSVTLSVGKQTQRNVNFIFKRALFQQFTKTISMSDSVCITFYVSSKFKNGRWYTTALAMAWSKIENYEK